MRPCPNRAMFKFPGFQKVCISKKWGFHNFNADASEEVVVEKWLTPDWLQSPQLHSAPLDKWRALHT